MNSDQTPLIDREVDIWALIDLLARNAPTILVCSIFGALVGLLLCFFPAIPYESKATFPTTQDFISLKKAKDVNARIHLMFKNPIYSSLFSKVFFDHIDSADLSLQVSDHLAEVLRGEAGKLDSGEDYLSYYLTDKYRDSSAFSRSKLRYKFGLRIRLDQGRNMRISLRWFMDQYGKESLRALALATVKTIEFYNTKEAETRRATYKKKVRFLLDEFSELNRLYTEEEKSSYIERERSLFEAIAKAGLDASEFYEMARADIYSRMSQLRKSGKLSPDGYKSITDLLIEVISNDSWSIKEASTSPIVFKQHYRKEIKNLIDYIDPASYRLPKVTFDTSSDLSIGKFNVPVRRPVGILVPAGLFLGLVFSMIVIGFRQRKQSRLAGS